MVGILLRICGRVARILHSYRIMITYNGATHHWLFALENWMLYINREEMGTAVSGD